MTTSTERDCDALREEVAMLETQHRQLVDRNQRLQRENNELRAEVQILRAEGTDGEGC